MIGCYDFCGHYDWTFEWMRRQGGDALLLSFWRDAIGGDSQLHASLLIEAEGMVGMRKYWGHTLEEEAAGYVITEKDSAFRIDMHQCPSKGFLLRNDLEFSRDYCDHCMGWIGPVMEKAGYVIDHEHNHCGQCWWEMRKKDDVTPASSPGRLAGDGDVRIGASWGAQSALDVFRRAVSATQKDPHNAPMNPTAICQPAAGQPS